MTFRTPPSQLLRPLDEAARDYNKTYHFDPNDPSTDIRQAPCDDPSCGAKCGELCRRETGGIKASPHIGRQSAALRIVQARREKLDAELRAQQAQREREANDERIARDRERVRGKAQDDEKIGNLDYDDMIMRGSFEPGHSRSMDFRRKG